MLISKFCPNAFPGTWRSFTIRHGFFNACRLLNLLHTSLSHLPEMIWSLNVEKTSNRVEWDYLYYTLDKCGFGQNFISWINLLYNSPVAQIQKLLFAVAIEPFPIFNTTWTVSGSARLELNIRCLFMQTMSCFISQVPWDPFHAFDIFNTFGVIS